MDHIIKNIVERSTYLLNCVGERSSKSPYKQSKYLI